MLDRKDDSSIEEDPAKSSYALKLLKENESLKGKLAEIEASSQMCFHGKNLPPSQNIPQNSGNLPNGVCNNHIRSSIEQSHAQFQHQQNLQKSVVRTIFRIFHNCWYHWK